MAEIEKKWALAIHGGAGNVRVDSDAAWWTASYKEEHLRPLREALKKGGAILNEGGAALDAVQEATLILEDSEWFNAGKGACYTSEGTIELDASIMDGATGEAGAVGAVQEVKNPVLLAREVMKTPYVLLVGEGARRFALDRGMELVPQEYYRCPLNQLLLAKARGEAGDTSWHCKYGGEGALPIGVEKHGTVGAVALDSQGRLAAATSTGGIVAKIPGRIGDSCILGAGNFADHHCAISCTGQGEGFIRRGVARDISAKMRYLGLDLDEAMRRVILQELQDHGIQGGAIGVGSDGAIAIYFNTDSMFRGWASSDGTFEVKLAIDC